MKVTYKGESFEEPKVGELDLNLMRDVIGLYYGYTTRLQQAEQDQNLDDIILCNRLMMKCDKKLADMLVAWDDRWEKILEDDGIALGAAVEVFSQLTGDIEKNS